MMARAARVVARAHRVFEDADVADRWLRTANRALGGAVPIELADHDTGARFVETVLERLAYGDYT